LGMALDEPKEADHVFDEKGVTFVIDKELLEETKPITVDYVTSERGEGFAISSNLKKEKSECGSCSC
jgi:iron-sulfur cluster assembly protein